jgi:hypothetical protein
MGVLRGLTFTSPDGTPLRRSNFNRRVWQLACAELGISGLRFHDLRHTGNTIAASTGASTKELMARMGHASPRAALIYQHATIERDRTLADALSRLAGRLSAISIGEVIDPRKVADCQGLSGSPETPKDRRQELRRPGQCMPPTPFRLVGGRTGPSCVRPPSSPVTVRQMRDRVLRLFSERRDETAN